MSALLGLGGLVGAVVSLIFFVIRAIQKKPKKKAVIALLVCVALFIVAIAMPDGETNEASVPTEEPVQAEETTQTGEAAQAEEALTFVLMDGEAGEYGEEVVLNEGTEFEEHEIAYHIPAGTYSVTNLNDQGGGQVSVYSGGPEYDGEWQYFVADDDCARPIVVMGGETKELTVKEGQFVVLSDDTSNIQFVLK